MDVRIPPSPLEELGPLARVVAWGAGVVTRGEPPGIFTTLGRHRRLLRAWLPFAGTMLMRTCLPRADVELLVLRTACNCSSPYEWVQHASLARRAGLTIDVIEAVPDWHEHSRALTDRQRLLLAAADELHEHKVISDGTWIQLASELDQREQMELCMLVGHYAMVAMTLNSLGVEPEASAVAALDGSSRQTADLLDDRLDSWITQSR
ncbi:MAG: carboxymuconolactone decarboxylase family protein [Acidimicrobiales bacterium]